MHLSEFIQNVLSVHFTVCGLPCGSAGKESAHTVGDLGSVLDWENPLEKGKATLSNILA